MNEVTIRLSGPEDAGAIAEVCNALSSRLHGTEDASEEHVRHWFELPNFAFWVAELDGRVVGYVDVQHQRDVNRFETDIRVNPDAWGAGVATALLDTAESWARERGDPGPAIRTFPAEGDSELRAAIESRGYRPIRHFFRMQIDFDGPSPEFAWPDGIALRAYDPETDDERVHAAHMDSFADHWGFHHFPFDEWRAHMIDQPGNDTALWKLAEADGELAGISINAWHVSGDQTFGWVRVLGVRRPWRRRGLGLALLLSSFEELRSRGATRVGLGVDAQNPTGAVGLYERAGMRVVRREDTYEKEL